MVVGRQEIEVQFVQIQVLIFIFRLGLVQTHVPGRKRLWINLFALPGVTKVKAVREPKIPCALVLVRFIIFHVLSRPLFEDLTHIFALAHAQGQEVLVDLMHIVPKLLGP